MPFTVQSVQQQRVNDAASVLTGVFLVWLLLCGCLQHLFVPTNGNGVKK